MLRALPASLLALALMPALANAQVVIAETPCPPCPPTGYCPPCTQATVAGEVEVGVEVAPAPIVTLGPPTSRGVVGPPTGVVTVTEEPPPPIPDTRPAPGTFALAYLGSWDDHAVWSGGGLRFTGHLVDFAFLEVTLGVLGRTWDATRDLIELPLLVGFRMAAPVSTPMVRVYGTFGTGIALHTLTNLPDSVVWGVLPVEAGGGLELGGPLDERFSIGGFLDVRFAMRVPFEREDFSLGVSWSAGVAFLWF